MKASAAVLGVSAFALSVASIPVAAAVIGDGGAGTTVSESPSGTVQAFEQASAKSDASLAGTGAAFLLLGIGTLSVAHRRRWRTVDLRDASPVSGAVAADRA